MLCFKHFFSRWFVSRAFFTLHSLSCVIFPSSSTFFLFEFQFLFVCMCSLRSYCPRAIAIKLEFKSIPFVTAVFELLFALFTAHKSGWLLNQRARICPFHSFFYVIFSNMQTQNEVALALNSNWIDSHNIFSAMFVERAWILSYSSSNNIREKQKKKTLTHIHKFCMQTNIDCTVFSTSAWDVRRATSIS